MKLSRIIATGLGTGYTPVAPGTAGSILGVLLLFLINTSFNTFHLSFLNIAVLNLFIIFVVTALGLWSIRKVHQKEKHDASIIVIDEIIGVWISLLAVPLHWQYYLIGLILFRLFDIYKPLFIRKLDKLSNNWSVMLDDILAGVYALILLQAYIYIENLFCFKIWMLS